MIENPSAFTTGAASIEEPGAILNELLTQFEYAPRSFRLLSNEGVFSSRD